MAKVVLSIFLMTAIDGFSVQIRIINSNEPDVPTTENYNNLKFLSNKLLYFLSNKLLLSHNGISRTITVVDFCTNTNNDQFVLFNKIADAFQKINEVAVGQQLLEDIVIFGEDDLVIMPANLYNKSIEDDGDFEK